MRVVVVSGIWPPDVGGPASHAPALASFLHGRGPDVAVVTTADTAPAAEPYDVTWVRRSLPRGARHVAVTSAVRRAARRADVVYATSMIRRTALGTAAARRPFVAKLVADEAYERARRRGAFSGSLEEFQTHPGSARIRALRATRTAALRRAAHVVTPSAYLRAIALGWGLDAERVSVIPNPAPPLPALPSREDARAELGIQGPLLGLAGRLTAQKAVEVAFAALAETPGVTLAIRGDGPERESLERRAHAMGLDGRVRFLGAGSRSEVLSLFRASDAALLSSSWENFPHTVVEALAVGTPVVATTVGGIPEVVDDGVNGLLVPAGDHAALAAAITRVMEDDALRARLAEAAAPSVAPLREDVLLERVETLLDGVGRR